MENIDDNYLNFQNEENQQENENIIQTSEEKKSKIMFNEIIDDLIRKKTNKENEMKIQIEKNKKNLLEKFYSMSNEADIINNTINMNNININNKNINNNIINNINSSNNEKKNIIISNNSNQQSSKENNNNIININKNLIIPNNMNPNLNPEGQKEYEEIREKYKNERNKKKSSIFKSEDLRISNTNSVHLKKEDFSPINPNMVNIETKNNILIIQKKLFGDAEANEETSKVENIDEIDDLDFEDLNIKDFKKEDNLVNNNIGKASNSNSNFNITNLDTNNINFDLSSNLKSEINENETNIYFPNEILIEQRAVQYFYFGCPNKKDNIYDKYRDFKKQNNRTKNFSVQLVSKLDYYTEDENKINIKNKKRKSGSNNQEVMNEMHNFIKNLIPQNMGNNLNNNFNGNKFNYGFFDKINNNININNINNNININNNNLAEIISQQQLKQKNIITQNNNSQKNGSDNYLNIINKSNTVTKKNNYINKGNNNINKNINNNISANIINKIRKKLQKENKSITQPNYKKLVISQKPFLNNVDLNENINKTKTKIKLNYRHISNSHIPQINNNITNINSNSNNNQTSNNIKHKRKNNSVIIKRNSIKDTNDKNKEIFLINNNNKEKEKKNFYHYNTNNNFENRNNNNEINSVKNNIKNIINQLPSFYKNPMTTKNKKVPISKIIKKRVNANNLSNSNGSNSINNINNRINYSSHNANSNSTSNANINTSNTSKNKKTIINNININTGNKFAILNTLHKNNLIKFSKLAQQVEAINKLKQYSYLGIYFIYVEKIKEGFLFKGIYKRGLTEINTVCNKIYGVQNTPLMLSYEKFLILIENNKKEFIPVKINEINIINYTKTILLVKND